ncbi:MAG: tolB protein precursor, partial [Myxococcaceae bacterium]|nr:tolB protein precursor [Myxococcaceae bacterium]
MKTRERATLVFAVFLGACASEPLPAAPADAAASGDADGRVDLPLSDDAGAARFDISADGGSSDAGSTDGGSSDGGSTDGAPDAGRSDEVVALAIDPPTATVRVVDATARVGQRFAAVGRTRDGRPVPVTALWALAPTTLATVDAAGLATTTNRHGGDGVVTARFGTLAATATLRVVLDLAVTPAGTPPGAADLFPAGAVVDPDPARTPTWVYPANETVFPQNVARNLFQWRPSGNDRFRVTFESDRSRVVVFTGGAHPTCAAAGTGLACFEPDADVWRYLAAS